MKHAAGRVVPGLSGAVFAAAVAAVPASAAPSASTYALVLEALQSGKSVRVVSDLSHCVTRGTGQAGPPIESGLQITAFIALPNKGIFFSDVHPTLDATDHPVTEYVRYNLAPDGNLTMTVERLNGGVVTKQDPLVCQVPSGARFIW
jgi:VirK protein